MLLLGVTEELSKNILVKLNGIMAGNNGFAHCAKGLMKLSPELWINIEIRVQFHQRFSHSFFVQTPFSSYV